MIAGSLKSVHCGMNVLVLLGPSSGSQGQAVVPILGDETITQHMGTHSLNTSPHHIGLHDVDETHGHRLTPKSDFRRPWHLTKSEEEGMTVEYLWSKHLDTPTTNPPQDRGGSLPQGLM